MVDSVPVDDGGYVDNGGYAVDGDSGDAGNIASATPTANVFAYTLYYQDQNGQTQTYGDYKATVYADGTIDWGGLVEAETDLTSQGTTNWPSDGQFVETVAIAQ